MKINLIPTLILVISSLALFACQTKTSQVPVEDDYLVLDQQAQDSPSAETKPSSPSSDLSTNPHLAINTDYGQIVIELFADKAPNTTKNFLDKVESGYYDGLIFHRVVPDFVVQGGDPTGTGTGGGKIKSELNQIPFKTGSLGLARTPDTKEVSNDSQFFICLSDTQCASLTGDYVNFGQVISGMNFVNMIQVGDKINSIITATK